MSIRFDYQHQIHQSLSYQSLSVFIYKPLHRPTQLVAVHVQ